MSFEQVHTLVQTFDIWGHKIHITAEELKKVAENAFKAIENADRLEKKVQSAEAEFAKLNAQLEKQGAHAEQGKLGQSFTGVTVLPGTPGLAPGEIFSVEQINRLGQRIFDTGPGEKYAKTLADLSSRIEKLMGPDNYIAKLLEIEIPYLRKGARSADEATALVQSVLIPFMAAFQRELANPTTPPEMRSMLQELIHLAQSCSGYERDQFENARRQADERKRQDEIRDLLNTDRHGMTKAQLEELDKKLKDLQQTSKKVSEGVDHIQQRTMSPDITSMKEYIELFSQDMERNLIATLGVSH
jgi:hypothetical protein